MYYEDFIGGKKRLKVDFVARFSRPWEKKKGNPQSIIDNSSRNALGGYNLQFVPGKFGDIDNDWWGEGIVRQIEKSIVNIEIARSIYYPNKKFAYGYVVYYAKDPNPQWSVLHTNLKMYSTLSKGLGRTLNDDDMTYIIYLDKCEYIHVQWGDKGFSPYGFITVYGGGYGQTK